MSDTLEDLRDLGNNIDKQEADYLLCELLNLDLAVCYAFPDKKIDKKQVRAYQQAIKRRQSGEPIAYILGYQDFYDSRFLVNESVLIPRSETEILVDKALEFLKNRRHPRVLDLGTGSGAIGLSLAKESVEKAEFVLSDFSKAALAVAENNAKNLGLKKCNLKCILSNWYENITPAFDLIVSNPPYLAEGDVHLSLGDLRFEPQAALVSQEGGFADLAEIILQAPLFLKASGCLMVEHGFEQSRGVSELFEQAGFKEVEICLDLSGHARVSLGILEKP